MNGGHRPLFTEVKMASLQIFARSKLSSILKVCQKTEFQKIAPPSVIEIQKRWSRYQSSPIYKNPSKYTDFEISSDPKEWEHVERLLPYKTVPKPSASAISATGWKPQNVENKNLPYFVPRTKNHMQPVYLILSHRGMRKMTYIRKVQGDIWKFEEELKEHLRSKRRDRKVVASRISELAGVVVFNGDHVSATKEWLDMKGF